MQLPHSVLVPAKYFTQTDSLLRLLYFLSAFQISLQQKSFVFKLVTTKPECVFWSNVPFICHTTFLFLPDFFFLRWKKMQLALPDGTFITVTNILTEAYLFTLSLLVPREMRFTIRCRLPQLKFSVKSVTLCQSLVSKMNQYIFSLFFFNNVLCSPVLSLSRVTFAQF